MRSAHCEIRPGENVTLQFLSHDGRPAPQPYVKGLTITVNSIFNGNRREDIWLDNK